MPRIGLVVLRPIQSTRADRPQPPERLDQILTVPYAAVQNRYGVNHQFIVKGDRVSSVEVKLGDRLGERVEIIDGMSAGMPIVISDVDHLADGTKVQSGSRGGRGKQGT